MMSGTVYLTQADPIRKLRHFYKLFLAPSLFGGGGGRVGAAGRVQLDHFDQIGAALLAMQELVRQKKRRGYVRSGTGYTND